MNLIPKRSVHVSVLKEYSDIPKIGPSGVERPAIIPCIISCMRISYIYIYILQRINNISWDVNIKPKPCDLI